MTGAGGPREPASDGRRAATERGGGAGGERPAASGGAREAIVQAEGGARVRGDCPPGAGASGDACGSIVPTARGGGASAVRLPGAGPSGTGREAIMPTERGDGTSGDLPPGARARAEARPSTSGLPTERGDRTIEDCPPSAASVAGARGGERPLPLLAALLLFAAALGLFCAFAGGRLFHQSAAPHFVYQAAAWLDGHLSIDVLPPNDNDWARAPDGSLHVSFPPGPALLLLPLVARWGHQTGDVFFTCVLAALAIVALAWALGRRAPELALGARCALAALFAVGTVFLPAAVRGEVWFTAHVVGVLALCVLAGASANGLERPWLAGLALGLGAITRTPLALAATLPLLDALLPEGRPVGRAAVGAALRRLAIVGLAAAPFAAFALALNAARFGDPLEFGHRLLHENRVLPVMATHGLFSFTYLPRNVEAALLLLPRLQPAWPPLLHDPRGMSLLVTTPPLALLAFPPRWRRGLLPVALPALLLAVPGLLYMNTGWVQFGHRFSLDWLPLGFVLLARLGWPARAWFWLLAAPGVVVCVIGGLVF